MDQMTALRQLAEKGTEIAASPAYLFSPGETLAIRPGGMNGTPLPHEEPQEVNPPAGVLAYYWLKSAPTGPLKLELVASNGRVVACAASDTPVKPVDTEAINVQAIWQQPAEPPSAQPGMHRFALNVAGGRGFGGGGGFGGRAETPPADACTGSMPPPARPARGAGGGGGGGRGAAPGLQPGTYTVRLTVDGKVLNQPATIKPDPRGAPVGATPEGMDDRK